MGAVGLLVEPTQHPRRLVGVAVAASVVASLPVAMVGAMAGLMRVEFSFGESELGLLVAAYFLTSAMASVPVGRVVVRLGAQRVLLVALLGLILTISMAALTRAWWQMALLMAGGGVANVAIHLSLNSLIADRIPPGRQGIAFGMKQAAVPFSTLVAGLSLPLVALTLGWRWSFLGAAAIAISVALLVGGLPGARPSGFSSARALTARARRPFVVLAAAMMFAGAAGSSLTPFVVDYSLSRGFAPVDAGLVLAAGAAFGVACRVVAGWVADRIGKGSLLLMAFLLGSGALGLVWLGFGRSDAAVVTGVIVGFGGAWSWAGLLFLAIARSSKGQFSEAMSIVAIGPLVGAVVGPAAFGFLVEAHSYRFAWTSAAIAAAAGSVLVLVARHELQVAAGRELAEVSDE